MDKVKEPIKRQLHTPGGLHIRENGSEEAPSRTIAGYAIMFDTPSRAMWADEDSEAYEVIDRGAITRELLDSCDIKFTMFHDDTLLLARSVNGAGTLRYDVDDKGVSFEFEAPRTIDGDKVLELVRSGIIDGCSFAFYTQYWDSAFVRADVDRSAGKTVVTYHVQQVTNVVDFTVTPDPAYPTTSVEARSLADTLRRSVEQPVKRYDDSQVRAMRAEASRKMFN